jgi:hypothetical protein
MGGCRELRVQVASGGLEIYVQMQWLRKIRANP